MARIPKIPRKNPIQTKKIDEDVIQSYASIQHSEGHQRSYIDIETDRSVRTSFTSKDYYAFRPEESVPSDPKRLMVCANNAYQHVGIIHNTIDLMSDFASQGITISHPTKSVQRFGRKWWSKVNGSGVSERFLNYLYRLANVVVQRDTAKISKSNEKELRTLGAVVEIEKTNINKKEIPWRYRFINPIAVDMVEDRAGLFSGKRKFVVNLSECSRQAIKNSTISPLKTKIGNKDTIPLDPESTKVYYYKKDDWCIWAYPMVTAILDDINLMEKMKLADRAALDGAISQIRHWKVGNFEHKIIPTSAMINKVRDLLAGNTGGGVIDLVTGPEIDFKESATTVHQFLGSSKYEPILSSIYAGLGIPPTLTGSGGSGGGFTNNFVSLKTLIERLEYGRRLLNDFWEHELLILQKAMGFKRPFSIHYDRIILSDESTEKTLLKELVDRDIISYETIRERLKEDNTIEEARLKQEEKTKENKLGPFRESLVDGAPVNNGRPKNSKDKVKRKPKKVVPITKAEEILWASSAYEHIEDKVLQSYLTKVNKKDFRSLTKSEEGEFKNALLSFFSCLIPFQELPQTLDLNNIPEKSEEFSSLAEEMGNKFTERNHKKPTSKDWKNIYTICYSEIKH